VFIYLFFVLSLYIIRVDAPMIDSLACVVHAFGLAVKPLFKLIRTIRKKKKKEFIKTSEFNYLINILIFKIFNYTSEIYNI